MRPSTTAFKTVLAEAFSNHVRPIIRYDPDPVLPDPCSCASPPPSGGTAVRRVCSRAPRSLA